MYNNYNNNNNNNMADGGKNALSIALPIKMLPMHEEWPLHKMSMCEESFTLC